MSYICIIPVKYNNYNYVYMCVPVRARDLPHVYTAVCKMVVANMSIDSRLT